MTDPLTHAESAHHGRDMRSYLRRGTDHPPITDTGVAPMTPNDTPDETPCFLTTEDGDILTTEDGSPLTTEQPPPPESPA